MRKARSRINSTLFFTLLAITMSVNANISGTVFKDYNANSTKDPAEPGVAGILVNAYDDTGAVFASDTTIADGSFDIATVANNYRIEVTNVPNYLKPTANTGSLSANVKPLTFNAADGTTGINIGLNNPAEFVDANPDIAMTFQGNSDGTAGLFSSRILRNADIPADGSYDNNGANTVQAINGDISSTIGQTGSIWGVAYDSLTDEIYVAATIRRHAALGPLGTGGIYKINATTFAVTQFTTVAGTGTVTANASRNLQANPQNPGHDPLFNEIGRNGLGDLDISDDGTKLYTINLNANTLVEIPLANPAPANHIVHAIGNPFGAGCANNDVKSWGIGQNDGKVYVGSVCTTNLTQGAYVSQFDGTSFIPFHQIPLNMQGENSVDNGAVQVNNLPANARWRTWATLATDIFNPANPVLRISYPAPILSDIVFDENNGMILGFIDRTAMQAGHDNYAPSNADNNLYRYDSSGDIYRVCKVGGNYFNEGDASCPQTPAPPAAGLHYTPFAEYFGGEEWNPQHSENSLGGLSYQQGSHRILSTAFDPVDPLIGGNHVNHSNSGIQWLNTVDGTRSSGIRMAGNKSGSARLEYFAKAGGIGDVEYLNAPAPIEVGNYVWEDLNNDGIQDPSEPPIGNVTVKLFKAGVEVGSATTDANGAYYFGGLLNTNMTGGNTLVYEMTYQLRIALNDPSLGGKIPTVQNSGAADNRDSDGDNSVLNAGFSSVEFQTGKFGENNHQYDFGFISFKLGNYVWYDANQDGIQDASENGVNGITVALFNDANCTAGNELGAPTVTANGGMPAADGWYEFSPLPVGTYCVKFSNIPAGYTVSPAGTTGNALDSDAVALADPTMAVITNISITQDDPDEDMGIFIMGSVSGLVWCESGFNENLTYDAADSDTLQSNIGVTLYEDTNCNDILDGAENATAVSQNTVGGSYLFSNLLTSGPSAGSNPPGCYIVEVDALDPDLGLCKFPITATTLTPDVDAVVPDSIDNNFGNEEHLLLGNYVWYDNNQDGLQDATEIGVNGITATLFYDATCSAGTQVEVPINTSNGGTPAADGHYLFTELPSGLYCIEFTNLPVGWVATLQEQGGDDAINSDMNPATFRIENINLTNDDLDEDAGIYAAIGEIPGTVFCDSKNFDGNLGLNEGQPNIAVTLNRDSDCDGIGNGVGDFIYATVDTDANGEFNFINLPVANTPIPPNLRVCYTLEYDTNDLDLNGCDLPFLPLIEGVELTVDAPVSDPQLFGHHFPPLPVPINKWWAIMLLIGFVLMYVRRFNKQN